MVSSRPVCFVLLRQHFRARRVFQIRTGDVSMVMVAPTASAKANARNTSGAHPADFRWETAVKNSTKANKTVRID